MATRGPLWPIDLFSGNANSRVILLYYCIIPWIIMFYGYARRTLKQLNWVLLNWGELWFWKSWLDTCATLQLQLLDENSDSDKPAKSVTVCQGEKKMDHSDKHKYPFWKRCVNIKFSSWNSVEKPARFILVGGGHAAMTQRLKAQYVTQAFSKMS